MWPRYGIAGFHKAELSFACSVGAWLHIAILLCEKGNTGSTCASMPKYLGNDHELAFVCEERLTCLEVTCEVIDGV